MSEHAARGLVGCCAVDEGHWQKAEGANIHFRAPNGFQRMRSGLKWEISWEGENDRALGRVHGVGFVRQSNAGSARGGDGSHAALIPSDGRRSHL